MVLKKGSACEGVLKAIRSIIRAADLQSKMLDLKYGITGPQLVILYELEHNRLITTSELANNISISQSTATIIINTLVKKQLVDRVRDTADKRKWFINLTTNGKELLKNKPPLLDTQFIAEFEKLPDWEQFQILANFQRIVLMFNVNLRDESAPIITSSNDELR